MTEKQATFIQSLIEKQQAAAKTGFTKMLWNAATMKADATSAEASRVIDTLKFTTFYDLFQFANMQADVLALLGMADLMAEIDAKMTEYVASNDVSNKTEQELYDAVYAAPKTQNPVVVKMALKLYYEVMAYADMTEEEALEHVISLRLEESYAHESQNENHKALLKNLYAAGKNLYEQSYRIHYSEASLFEDLSKSDLTGQNEKMVTSFTLPAGYVGTAEVYRLAVIVKPA